MKARNRLQTEVHNNNSFCISGKHKHWQIVQACPRFRQHNHAHFFQECLDCGYLLELPCQLCFGLKALLTPRIRKSKQRGPFF